MEARRFDGAAVSSHFGNGFATNNKPVPPPRQVNYGCEKVQRALEHLASIELIELCNEAKVERCRATRDLRSCGRSVESVLNSCSHASLCAECSQRCDICPICRIPLPKNGNRLRLRLYYECIEAGLISKRCDDRFQEKEDADQQLTADVGRLYSLFDVAIENNLVSLICHYVTDVCMDESAVSSDPVVAFLLDEVVVKDWCKRAFGIIIMELQRIYGLSIQEMKERLGPLLRFSVKLAGISNVLDVLESSFKGSLSAQFHDLHHLQENVFKTKQHLEMIIWCIRHQFLENVRSRHSNYSSWRSIVHERKSAAIQRSWPDLINDPAGSGIKNGSTLFIEDALTNLDIEDGFISEMEGKSEISVLQKDGSSSFFGSKVEEVAEYYPFENLRAAIDILFLHGSSDLVVAKQAIFLYYLFDWHWKLPDDQWRYVVDDFAATFGISRHSILESLTFYLLDDHTDDALKEACSLLPEISGPTTHPKVAQVLLERNNPDAAFMVLRWSGQDGGADLVSLNEAVTAARVRVECGLLTEAFMYQRMLCSKLKKNKSRHDESGTWMNWVETLVTEICCLCIRRKFVDRIIELPWDSDEEKHIHKCLFDFAVNEPLTSMGSLLVVFYLQRYRYIEAYQVDRKLQILEQDFVAKNSVSEQDVYKMRSASHWRAGLVDKSIELLPEVQQQQVKTGKLPELFDPDNAVNAPPISDLPEGQDPILTSLLVPSSFDNSLSFTAEKATPFVKPSFTETPSKITGSVNSHLGFRRYGSVFNSQVSLFDNTERGPKAPNPITKNSKFDDITSPATRPISSVIASKTLTRNPWNSRLHDEQLRGVSPETGKNKFINQFQNTSSYSRNPIISSPSCDQDLFKDSAQGSYLNVSGKSILSERADNSWFVAPSGDLMDISWSQEEKDFPFKDASANGRPRWRSDDSSEDEEQQNPFGNGLAGNGAYKSNTPMRKARKSVFNKR